MSASEAIPWLTSTRHWSYALVTAPTEEPMTLAMAKKHARIDIDDENDLVDSWVRAARQQVEQDTGLKLLTQTWDLALDSFPYTDEPIRIQTGPVQSVSFLKYYDFSGTLQTWPTSNYTVDTSSVPARLGLTYGGIWPTNLRRFQPGLIEFVAGWASPALVPDALIRAMALWVGWFSEHREHEMITPGRTGSAGTPSLIERSAYDALIAPYVMYVAA